MQGIDWAVVGAYMVGMLVLAAQLGRRQQTRRDYFLGGHAMRPASLALSTIATQCSTNSLLGAPAFVGFALGGGMIWLQYELAVPLAMLGLMWLMGAMRRSQHISAYAFLEERLGRQVRLLASASFLLFRGVATGVTVYGVAIVLTLLVDLSYTQAVVVLMATTIAYDVLGGMRAVVVSDVLQLVLIVIAVGVSLVLLVTELGGFATVLSLGEDASRTHALTFTTGFAGEGDYGFWPMLIGGGFLYMAYYGCDQSQAQRVLASRSVGDTQRVLLLNGTLRFPIVLMYCVLGLALAAYARAQPEFIAALPLNSEGRPNYNLVYPLYVLSTFPPGVIGLVMVGIFAAAMSSIDSSLNALSASTVEDYLRPSLRWSERGLFLASKAATLAWGLFAVLFSYQVERIAPTVLEAINKIGSMVNGPLLALFTLALVLPGIGQRRAVAGFAGGLLCNVCLWKFAPGVSWLWWNAAGWLVAVAVAVVGGRWSSFALPSASPRGAVTASLVAMALGIFLVCLWFGITPGSE